LLSSGFHFAFPAPIDEVVKIPITQIQSVNSTVGWYASTPEQEATKTEPPPGPSLNPANDSYVLTGDANIIHVRAKLNYRVTDPVRYTFGFTNAPSLVTNALNEAILYASSQFTVDDILTKDKIGFTDRIYQRVQQLIDQQNLGIAIETPTVQTIPPRQLAEAFGRVLQVTVQRDKALNEARSYENEVLSKARSEAAARINAGETERTRTVEFVSADAEFFSKQLPEYQKNPALYREISLLQTMQRVMTNASEKMFIPNRADGKSRQLQLQLNREPQKTAK
jgi:membrane protease subunit HflK